MYALMRRLRKHRRRILVMLLVAMLTPIMWFGVLPGISHGHNHSAPAPVANLPIVVPTDASNPAQYLPDPRVVSPDIVPTCSQYTGGAWVSRLSPAIRSYSGFPSKASTSQQLAAVRPYLTASYYKTTAATWAQTTHPKYRSVKVEAMSCRLGRHFDQSQVLQVEVRVTSTNAQGNRRVDILPYDVFIVAVGNLYYVSFITPQGSLLPSGGY